LTSGDPIPLWVCREERPAHNARSGPGRRGYRCRSSPCVSVPSRWTR